MDENPYDADLCVPPQLDLSSDLSPNRPNSTSISFFKIEDMVDSSVIQGISVDLDLNRPGLVLMVASS